MCINYNERLWTRPACRFLHLCSECYSPHPKTRCNKKIMTNMETKGTEKKRNRRVETLLHLSDITFQRFQHLLILNSYSYLELKCLSDQTFVNKLLTGFTDDFDPGIRDILKTTIITCTDTIWQLDYSLRS